MKFFIKIKENESFKPGDIYINSSEVCNSNDGERAGFDEDISPMTIRPITIWCALKTVVFK